MNGRRVLGLKPGAMTRSSCPLRLTRSSFMRVIDPQTGTVYVVWRRYADPSAGTGDALWMSYSSDGGNKWVGPTQVASIIPYDQGSSGTTFRTNDTPAIAVSVDSTGTSRLHVAFSQRKAAINPVTLNCTDTTNNNCDARLTLMSATITKSGASFKTSRFSAFLSSASLVKLKDPVITVVLSMIIILLWAIACWSSIWVSMPALNKKVAALYFWVVSL